MTHTSMGSTPKNLELARELIAHLISEMCPIHRENEPIEKLLDAGDEYELLLLPGESLEDILDNLRTVVILASEPVPIATIGHDLENHYEATHQRDEIRLFAQVALALLDTDAAVDHQVDGTRDSLQRAEPLSTVCHWGETT